MVIRIATFKGDNIFLLKNSQLMQV